MSYDNHYSAANQRSTRMGSIQQPQNTFWLETLPSSPRTTAVRVDIHNLYLDKFNNSRTNNNYEHNGSCPYDDNHDDAGDDNNDEADYHHS